MKIRAIAFSLLLFLASPFLLKAQIPDSLFTHAVSFAIGRLNASVSSLADSIRYPRSTMKNGQWKTVGSGDWTSGFFPGCLWYGYELSGAQSLRCAAEKWTAGLENQQFNTRTHDVGFMMFCSYGNAYRLHPDEHGKAVLLQSAQSLATRFNEKIGCIRSWDNSRWAFPVIIDNMMNLELLFWAAKNGGGTRLFTIAVRHAATTMRDHVRKDGSTYHVVSYDSSTGELLGKETHQGFTSESVWARGQAWAMYGFTMAYRETKDESFLNAAERTAHWFIGHLPEDAIPYWDFDAPLIPDEPRDASAAAIAASALLELGGLTHSPVLKDECLTAAQRILASLCRPPYLSEGSNSAGILNHATGNRPAKLETDVSLIYADYYFLEALKRFKGKNFHDRH